jgi:hypothetical protein
MTATFEETTGNGYGPSIVHGSLLEGRIPG